MEEDNPLPYIETEGLLVLQSCLSVAKATEPDSSEVIGVTIKSLDVVISVTLGGHRISLEFPGIGTGCVVKPVLAKSLKA